MNTASNPLPTENITVIQARTAFMQPRLMDYSDELRVISPILQFSLRSQPAHGKNRPNTDLYSFISRGQAAGRPGKTYLTGTVDSWVGNKTFVFRVVAWKTGWWQSSYSYLLDDAGRRWRI